MDTSDQFKRAEDEYSRLKASLAAGRMTQEQFDAAVKQLVVQDAQGQYWALEDNGYWVRHEGAPPQATVASHAPSSAPAPGPQPATRPTQFPLAIVLAVAAACLVLVCGLSAGGLILRSDMFGQRIALAPTTAATIALAPSPIPTDTAAPTDPLPTLAPPSTQVALAPSVTASPSPSATATSVAPGLYVTSMRVDPAVPARRQSVQFFVTFLNTTSSVQNIRLVVYVFKPDNLTNALGQTTENGVTIVTGQGDQKSEGWKLNGGGGCENFVARVAFIEAKKVTYFKTPDGNIFELPFSVC